MASRIWPPEPPEKPYFRGISDIDGRLGSLTHGTYDRSYGFFVKSATAIAKRRGFSRALDEQAAGSGVVSSYRDKETAYYALVDADGVKLLSSVVVGRTEQASLGHPGLPRDTVNRTDSASMSYNGANEGDGDDSPQSWLENAGTTPLGGNWEIVTNQAVVRKLSTDGTVVGTVERNIEAPTSFYVCRVELDFSSYQPQTNGGATTDDYLRFFMGLPQQLVVEGTNYNARVYVADAIASPSWTGMMVELGFTSAYDTRVNAYTYTSNRKSGEAATLRGGRLREDGDTLGAANLAAFQDSYVLEFGRLPTGAGNEWRQRVRLWRGKTLDTIRGTDTADIDKSSIHRIDESPRDGDSYVVLPYGDAPQGGFFGMYGKVTRAGTNTTMAIERIDAAYEYL